jgi:hypothetical protein
MKKKIYNYSHLDHIAEEMWSNPLKSRVAIMVGSGFSLNGRIINESGRRMPLWHHAKREIFDRLYPDGNDKQFEKFGANSNRLAQEYELEHGTGKLNQLLMELVPDSNYAPGKVHELLFSLPWADILTTNYDTLLERSAREHSHQYYSVVKGQGDLVKTSSPRIVKLHGSFPNSFPLIITEEHFRTYPKEYPAFVNVAQQIMIENTLVLIGFSGDDPNFLAWSGWIRDNLSGNRRSIYLVGNLSLSKTQIRMLEDRRIYPIDYSSVWGSDESIGANLHEEAIIEFFRYLQLKRPPALHQWPNGEKMFSGTEWKKNASKWTNLERWREEYFFSQNEIPQESIKAGYERVDSILDELFQYYPNWIICPKKQSNDLHLITRGTLSYFSKDWKSLPAELAISLAQKLLRSNVISHSMLMLESERNFISSCIAILCKVNPFPDIAVAKILKSDSNEAPITPETNSDLNWGAIADAWIEIALRTPIEDFSQLIEALSEIVKRNPKWQNEWYFQKANEQRLNLRWGHAIDTLEEWCIKYSSLESRVRQALFYFDFGHLEKSKAMFLQIRRLAREQLIDRPQDISLLSIEGLAISGQIYSSQKWGKTFTVEDETRLRELRPLGADTWGNIWEFFENLGEKYVPHEPSSPVKNRFLPGQKSISSNNSGVGNPLFNEVAGYLNIFFSEGFPYRILYAKISDWFSALHHGLSLGALEKGSSMKDLESFLDAGRAWAIRDIVVDQAID